MKSSRLEACIGYIRFTLINEGIEPEDFDEKLFVDILQGDVNADDAIADYVNKLGLVRCDVPSDKIFAKYPGTRCIANYYGIKDKTLLDEVDRMISAMRMAQILEHPMEKSLSLDYFVSLHKHMFGDLYPSAGVFRTKSAAKRTEFVPPEMIERMLVELMDKLEATDWLKKLDEDDTDWDFLNELAYFMGELEAIHPFVDGNGRVTRFFISFIARRAGYYISWGAADPDQLLEASISAIDGDYQALVDLLEEITIPEDND